ncbi:FecR domain-containing protein [Bradyrhizobium sp. Ai1a-2]|uniref:FecR family protein n=1 Tax=Bradyrhizobium sp. Ai1a-2 TaxID=196490 RepID=UPI00048293B1|nr:FecR domain-containing protein [Bradyrhizobium sp. Ai1a-2]
MTEENDHLPLNPTRLEHEAHAWVVRFASGGASRDDLDALKRWSAQSPTHAAAFDRASRAWKYVEPAARYVQPLDAVVPGSEAATASSLTSERIGRRALIGGALAASVTGVGLLVARPPLGLWPSWSELSADYRTSIGERRQITLSDHVSVEMNTRTSIALRGSAENADQIELLGGEAIVTAPKASNAVTVLAADGRIVAADALFNIRYENRNVCVTCLQGQVHVEQRTAALPLLAGQQVIYSEDGIRQPVAIDSAAVTAWKDGVIIFKATPISDVIAEVNRYQSGAIVLTNAELGRKRFNARFRIANIGEVVGQIEQIFGARATRLPGGITLLG